MNTEVKEEKRIRMERVDMILRSMGWALFRRSIQRGLEGVLDVRIRCVV